MRKILLLLFILVVGCDYQADLPLPEPDVEPEEVKESGVSQKWKEVDMANLPNYGITTAMVYSVLNGVTPEEGIPISVGYLCTHQYINKWSRFKPYAYPSLVGIYGASGQSDTIIKNINFNLDPKVFDPSLLPKTPEAGATYGLWTGWSPPSGGPDEPFRLGDFRGYNHDALPPYGTLSFMNGYGGGKVPVSTDANDNNCWYMATLDLVDADIPLSDINMGPYGNFANSFLTMVLMYNLIGTDWQVFGYSQSSNTVAQGVADGSLSVSMITKTMESDGIPYNYTGIVVAVYIAPSSAIVPVGVSLKMDSLIMPVRYFTNASPETAFAHYSGGISYDDIPQSGVDISGTMSYPRYEPNLVGNDVLFDLIGINPSHSISGKIMCDLKQLNTVIRTVELGSFNAVANTLNSLDFSNTVLTLTDEEKSMASIAISVYPSINYDLEWIGNTLDKVL